MAYLALRQWYLKVYRYLKRIKQIEREKKKKKKIPGNAEITKREGENSSTHSVFGKKK